MFKTKLFWIIFILFFCCAIWFISKYSSTAISFINVDIKMNRAAALASAKQLSEKYGWGPKNHEQAAIFSEDYYLQFYIELEAGGKPAFNNFLKDGLYKPYIWNVRHFKENTLENTEIFFTPDGHPYGFNIKLPEELLLPNIPQDSALITAKQFATKEWQLNLDEYKIIETDKHQVLSGRIDHVFIFERSDKKIGEGFYRLNLTVSGNRITRLQHFIKIPDDFGRRYSEIRSVNNTLSMSAFAAVIILYGIGGITAIFLLLRNRQLIWKYPLICGLSIGALAFLDMFNFFPLYWFSYNPSVSKISFVSKHITNAFLYFLNISITITLALIAGEGLTRKAFPNRIQFWKLWSKDTANSKEVIGLTLGGYLITAFDFVYIIAFSIITTKYFNWWNPALLKTNPDWLTAFVPWFSPIVNALIAAITEETLFRAIPIAGMTIIGARFNRKKTFLITAIILQALIFGAGHANYAAQPAYSRIVELFIPSLIFAFLYLRFNLITAILMHFVYNAVLMSLPIWVADTENIWIDRIFFIFFFCAPVIIIFWRSLKAKKITNIINQINRNKFWQPPVKTEKIIEQYDHLQNLTYNPAKNKWLIIAGILGLFLFIYFTDFRNYIQPLNISRATAIKTAKNELSRQNINIDNTWTITAQATYEQQTAHSFIWREAGKEIFNQYSGNYLKPPLWQIKFVKFSAPVEERAEIYNFYIDTKNKIYKFNHSLPELQPREILEKTDAKEIADAAIKKYFNVNPLALKEVSVSSNKLPNRIEWTFVYADTQNYSIPDSELRYEIKTTGEFTLKASKYIYVSENWRKNNTNMRAPVRIINLLTYNIFLLLIITAIVIAIINWSGKKFDTRYFFKFLSVWIIFEIIIKINNWPNQLANFDTEMSYNSQLLIFIFQAFITALLHALAIAIIAGFIFKWQLKTNFNSLNIIISIFSGFIIVGVYSIISNFIPAFYPAAPPYISLYSNYLPFVGIIIKNIFKYSAYMFFALFVFNAIDRITNKWTIRKKTGGILLIVFGIIYLTDKTLIYFSTANIIFWLSSGIIFGAVLLLLYIHLIRFNINNLVIIIAVILSLEILQRGLLLAFPFYFYAHISAIICILILTFIILKKSVFLGGFSSKKQAPENII